MADLALIRGAMESQPPRMIGFSYMKKNGEFNEYTVEPYEINEAEGIFWGYKINDPKPSIRKFFIANIQNIQILDQVFAPRWELKTGI